MEGYVEGRLYELRRYDFAWAAPGCEGVEDNDFVVFERGVEFCFAVDTGLRSLYCSIGSRI